MGGGPERWGLWDSSLDRRACDPVIIFPLLAQP